MIVDEEPTTPLCEVCGLFPPAAQGLCRQCLDRERQRFSARVGLCDWIATGRHDPWCIYGGRDHPVGRVVRPRSAGAHWIAPGPEEPALTGRMLIAAALTAVGAIAGVAWFLSAYPVR